MELEHCTKRKLEQVQIVVGQAKKPKTSNSSIRGQQGRGRCAKCERSHSGVCRVTGPVCYTCGQSGHVSRDCPKKGLICLHCNQTSHKKADCPRLQGGSGAVVAPVSTTMRITNGCHAKADATAVKSRAFQLTTEEARPAPDIVVGT